MPQTNTHSKRVGKVELMRFLFCLLILLYHTGKDNKARGWMFASTISFFNKGFIGVDFFFLVTGFVTAAAIFKKLAVSERTALPSTGQQTWEFMWKKIAAILPFHIIIIIMTIIFRVGVLHRSLPAVIIKGLPSFFFVQMNGYSSSSFIGVEWYISSMLLALIIIYPLCLNFYDVFTHIIAPFTGLILSGFMILSKGTFGADGELNGLLTNGLVRAFAHICLGIFIFELVRMLREKEPGRGLRAALTVIEPLSYLTVLYMSMATGYTRAWMGSMLLFMMIGVTISFSGFTYGQRLFDNRLCYFLGKASLPVYLAQNLVRSIASRYVSDMKAPAVLAFTVGGTVLLGFILQIAVNRWQAGRAAAK